MIHYFYVDYGGGEYYKVAIEGDYDEALGYLQTFSRDVRYTNSREPKKNARKGRRLPNMRLIVRECKFAEELRPFTDAPLIGRERVFTVDPRHTVLNG